MPRNLMKKLLLLALALFLSIPMSCTGMAYIKNIFYPQEPTQKTAEAIKPQVAVIYISNEPDFKQLAINLTEAAKNNEIMAILLMIDNSGGNVGTFSLIHDLVKKIRTIKPVVSLITGGAYSCGYMLASATDYIIAPSGSEIGCIGTIVEIQRWKDAKKTGDIEATLGVEIFHGGEFKAISNPYNELTDKDRDYIQSIAEQSYDYFLKVVAENRNLSLENYKEWAEGKIFIASKALKLGLIDEIGTIFEAEDKIIELIRQKNPDSAFDKEMIQLAF